MSKEFIVNRHKLSAVECDITLTDCPVYKMLMEKRSAANSEYVGVSVCGNAVNVGTVIGHAGTINRAIIEMCMECNTKTR